LHLSVTAAQYDDSDEALAKALDDLLEDPDFIDAVADQVRGGRMFCLLDFMHCKYV
jgi:hypothetical protein